MPFQHTRWRTTAFVPIVICFFVSLAISNSISAQTTLSFESLPVPAAGFFNGDTDAGSPFRDNFTITGTGDNFGETEFLQLWEHEGVEFFNGYTPAFGSWRGSGWSNVVDTTTAGVGNQYASFAGGGSDGAGGAVAGENYAVAFTNSSYFNLPDHQDLESVDLTNTTYAGISMRDGDAFAKQFGGDTGNDEDFFSVVFTGYDGVDQTGNEVGSVEFFLADYRFADNALDYIVDEWTTVDLTSIQFARSVGMTFTTTDIGDFGPNTPSYVAFDNFSFSVTSVPEPGNLMLVLLATATFMQRRRKRI
ncbi:MAG: DUF4465 domain-containing protein [Mariniblastus sp.]